MTSESKNNVPIKDSVGVLFPNKPYLKLKKKIRDINVEKDFSTFWINKDYYYLVKPKFIIYSKINVFSVEKHEISSDTSCTLSILYDTKRSIS